MKPAYRRRPLATAIAFASGLIAASVQAQDIDNSRMAVLQEVVVTAEKREASLQETPISIAAFSTQDLENLGLSDMGDIGKSVPNFEITPFPNSKSALVLFIRGVGNNESQLTQDAAVGVYMDGVYVARSTGLAADVADIERIEVLRGPQGVLYGRNTTGGAVNIISAKPTGEFGFKQTFSGGEYDYWRSQTQVNLPEVAGISVKLSYDQSAKDGYRHNEGRGPDFEDEEKNGGRVAVRWAASDSLTVDYNYDVSKIRGPQGYYQILEVPAGARDYLLNQGIGAGIVDGFMLPTLRQYASDKRESRGWWTQPVRPSETDISGHNLTLTWELDSLTLKSITGYRQLTENVYQNYSGNPLIEALNFDYRAKHRQVSQEFQAIGEALEGRLQYVGGLYWFKEQGHEREFDTSSGFVVENRWIKSNNEAWALYGQMTWTPPVLNDRLDITLGARYTEDTREASKDSRVYFVQARHGEETYSNFNPSLTVNYRWTDDLSTYAKVVSGYKAGGFNSRSTEAGFLRPYDEEEVLSYEIGMKSTWLNNRLRANLSVFYNDWKDMQQNFILVPGTPFLTDTFNAGSATTEGFELELTAVPTDGLQISLSYAYTDAKFKSVEDVAGTYGPVGGDIAHLYTMPYAPRKSYSVAVDYAFEPWSWGSLSLNVNYSWRDDTVGTAPPQDGFDLPDYGLWNARLTLADVAAGPGGSLKFSLWGKNLTDEEYLLHSLGMGSTNMGWFGEPRSAGIDITYEYR